MKAHIARNQNAGVPLVLGWNLSPADRGKLEGMAPAFGMKLLLVSPADAGKTVAQLLGEVETKAARTLVLEPGAYPPAVDGLYHAEDFLKEVDKDTCMVSIMLVNNENGYRMPVEEVFRTVKRRGRYSIQTYIIRWRIST